RAAATVQHVRAELVWSRFIKRIEQDASEQRMLVAFLKVDLADIGCLVMLSWRADCDQSALIRGDWLRREHLVGDEHGNFAVLRGIDTVVYEWSAQSSLSTGVASRRSERSPVAGQHCGRHDELLVVGRV